MPMQSATGEWATVTLASNEIWQARVPVMVTADSAASTSMTGDNGVFLAPGEALTFVNGDVIVYRAMQGATNAIWREPTA